MPCPEFALKTRHLGLRPTRRALAVAAVLGGLLAAGTTQAKTITWTGCGSGQWNLPTCWDYGRPVSGDDLVFAGSRDLSNYLNILQLSFHSLSFNAGAGAFVINDVIGGGAWLTSAGNIINSSSNLQTLNAALIIGASQTWSGGAAGLSFKGLNFFSPQSQSYTVTGSGLIISMGNIINSSGRAQRLAAVVTLGAAQTWTDFGGGLAVDGMAGGGALTLGSSTLTLGSLGSSSAASYSGTITATTGGINFSSAGGTQTLSGSGSTLQFLNVSKGNLVLNGGSLASDIRLTGGTLSVQGAALTLLTPDNDWSFLDGASNPVLAISGTGGAVTGPAGMIVGHLQSATVQVSDRGSLQLAQALYVGDTSGSQGTLSVSSNGAVSVQRLAIAIHEGATGTVTVNGAGAVLNVSGTDSGLWLGSDPSNQGVGGSARLSISNGGKVTTTATTLGSADSFLAIGAGALVTGSLSGSVGAISLLDGDPGLAPAALNINGSSGSARYAGGIAGTGSVLKTGRSVQVLAGANTFTGTVQVHGGMLEMTNGAASAYAAGSGGTLKLGFGNLGFSVVQADLDGTVVYGNSTLQGGTLVGGGTHDVSRVTRFVSTSISNGVNLELAGNATLLGVNSAGNLHVAGGQSAAWTGGGNAGGSFTVDGTANLANWTSAGVVQVGTAGVVNVSNGSLALLGGSRTYLGTKAEHGGVVNLGPYSTIELNGALLVNNGSIHGTTNVNYGSLAKGAGVYGAVNVREGGVFEAGNSPGAVRTGNATWNAGGSYLVAMDLADGAAGINSGLWNVDGTLDITAGANAGHFTIRVATLDPADHAITLADFNAWHDYSWLIASASGGISGYSAGVFRVDSSGFLNRLEGGRFSVAQAGNGLYLNFTSAVPEPASGGLMAAGALLLWLARRRRPQPVC